MKNRLDTRRTKINVVDHQSCVKCGQLNAVGGLQRKQNRTELIFAKHSNIARA